MGFRFSFPIPVKINGFKNQAPYMALSWPEVYVHIKTHSSYELMASSAIPVVQKDVDQIGRLAQRAGWTDEKVQVAIHAPKELHDKTAHDFWVTAIAMSIYHIAHKRFNRQNREELITVLLNEKLIQDEGLALCTSIGGILFFDTLLPYVQMRLPQGIHCCMLYTETHPSTSDSISLHRWLLFQKACLLSRPALLKAALYQNLSTTREYTTSGHLGILPTELGGLHLFENKTAMEAFEQQHLEKKPISLKPNQNGFDKS